MFNVLEESVIDMRVKVATFRQTCIAVPSQWEGTLEDGRMFYVRFRNGKFRVSVSPGPTSDILEAVRGERIVEYLSDDPRDGFMDEPEMRRRTETVLDFTTAARLEFED